MQQPSKNIILAVVVMLIVVSIGYLQYKKPAHFTGNAQDVLNIVNNNRTKIISEKSKDYSRAKEIDNPAGFINIDSLKLSDLVGKKVILLDFWTYSCINCQRTLPYLEAWSKKYKDAGLVIVGVHTPEFDFEKKYDNVSIAAKRLGIEYPIVLDSNHGTWSAYQNQYWPHEYLIDIDGFVVHDHIGEGGYEETEKAIQEALKERNAALGVSDYIDTGMANPIGVIPMEQDKVKSPETYFGSDRNQYLTNGQSARIGIQNFSVPSAISSNKLYLGGTWNILDQFAKTIGSDEKIVYKYNAKNVYFVASSDEGATIKILLDGKLLDTILIKENRLYDLIKGDSYGEHTIEIQIENGILDAYTFTFG